MGHLFRIQALYESALWNGIRPHVTVLGDLPWNAQNIPFNIRQNSIDLPHPIPPDAIIDTKHRRPRLPAETCVISIYDSFPARANDGDDIFPHHYPTDTQWVLHGGPMYAPLRMQFTQWRRQEPKQVGKLRSIVVALGGGDSAYRHLDRIGELVAWLSKDIWVCIYGGIWDVRYFKTHWGMDVTVCRTMEDSALMLKDFDLAITPASMTALELLCLGIPILPFAVNREQARIRKGLHACDVTFPLQKESFEADPWERERKSQNALDLVDGRGAERILKTLF